jgi:hypothetical protein
MQIKDIAFPLANFGDPPASHIIQKESPRARLMMVLKAMGKNNKQIWEELKGTDMECSIECVKQTVRQTWFAEGLVKILAARGADISKKLEAIENDAIAVAYEIMMDDEQASKTRAECAFAFLKAKNGTKVTVETKPQDLKSLKEEEERLKIELEELQGNPTNRMQDFVIGGNS